MTRAAIAGLLTVLGECCLLLDLGDRLFGDYVRTPTRCWCRPVTGGFSMTGGFVPRGRGEKRARVSRKLFSREPLHGEGEET